MAKDNLIQTTVGEAWEQRGAGAVVYKFPDTKSPGVIAETADWPHDHMIRVHPIAQKGPLAYFGLGRETLNKSVDVPDRVECWVPAL